MFNRRGIEAVGVRELARDLGISVGNLSYYYPKKEDILVELSKQMSRSNDRLMEEFYKSDYSVEAFLALYRKVFENQLAYRCIQLQGVNILYQYPDLHKLYSERFGPNRYRRLFDLLKSMREKGELPKQLPDEDLKQKMGYISLIGRFWIAEAASARKQYTDDENIAYYLGLLRGVLVQ